MDLLLGTILIHSVDLDIARMDLDTIPSHSDIIPLYTLHFSPEGLDMIGLVFIPMVFRILDIIDKIPEEKKRKLTLHTIHPRKKFPLGVDIILTMATTFHY